MTPDRRVAACLDVLTENAASGNLDDDDDDDDDDVRRSIRQVADGDSRHRRQAASTKYDR